MRKVLLSVTCLLLLATSHAYAADRLVPGTYATINAALAAAVGGDVIKIDPGTYVECIVLPNKGTQTPIIIRSSTADANLPAAGVRINPATTHGGTTNVNTAVMPILKAANTSCSVLETAVGASDYQIGPGLKFEGVPNGYRGSIELGQNDTSQQFEADQPKRITIDRVWVKGDLWVGQKVGIDINGRDLTIKNSYIEGIKGIAQDAVGIRCFNGTGPLTIYNNFINAAGYGFICGGDRPNMMTYADINAGATATTATLSNFKTGHTIATLHVGQYVSILTTGGTLRQHPKVISCGTSTPGAVCTSNNITFETLTVAPDTGTASDIQWGAIPSDISIRRNYFWKDPAWMDNILATPVISAATPNTTAGTLAAGTYYYRVQATYCCYQTTRAYSSAAIEAQAVLTATGQVALTWGAVSGPSTLSYRVFRSTTSGTYAGYIDVGNVTSYTDTGTTLTGTSTPPGGTNWVMKNAMEIKFANRVQIDSNIFENSPVGSESGYGIWFKSNEYGGANYMHTRDVVFEKNVMDGMDGCFSILGRIDNTGANFTRPLENLTIRNNICFDSNTFWMQGKASVYAIKTQSPVVNLTIENNTFQHTMKGLMYLTQTTNALSSPLITNFSFRNNIARKETYAVFGSGCAQNNITECFTEAVTGTSSFTGNVLGGQSGATPAGNLNPPYTEYEGTTHFTNYQHTGGTAADFALKVTSSWKGTAVGGGDPGANIAAITTAVTGVTAGALEGTSAPDITTTTLTNVPEDVAITPVTFGVTGGTAPYTWTVAPGSTLPAGLSFSSAGVLSGTPTTPGTYTWSVKVTDSTGGGTPLSDTQQLTLTITPTSAALDIQTTSLAAMEIGQTLSLQLVAIGGTPPYTWSVNTGSTLPVWLTLSPTGLLVGTPDVNGTFNFTLKVTDAAGTPGTDTQAYSLVVNRETLPCNRGRQFVANNLTFEYSTFRRATAPTTAPPDCATKGDKWINTTTNEERQGATVNGSFGWVLPSGADAAVPGTVILGDPTPPTDGQFIIGNGGEWTKVGPGDVTGLDASAIKTGVFPLERIPARIDQTVTVRADATDYSMPATASFSEITSSALHRVKLDLTNATQMRIHFMQTAVAVTNPRIEIGYSLNNGGAWTLSGISATFGTVVNTYITGAWTDIPPGMKADVLLRIGTIGGNGSESPDVANIYISYR